MTYTADSPAVHKALATYAQRPGSTEGRMAVVLNQHKRGLRERITITERSRDALADECARLRDAQVERDAIAARNEILRGKNAEIGRRYDEKVSELGREQKAHRATAAERDRRAASLPVWQPVKPGGTVIKAGTRMRQEWPGGAREWVWADTCAASSTPTGLYLDPRTIPAEPQPEPIDPDADVIEDMAAATARCDDYEWPHDLSDSDRESYRAGARAALAAYRAHIDQEA